jgi:hypothetical protein
MPGTYYVTLTYGHATQKQPFVVKLDPTLQTTQAQLQQRFDLLMRIHDALNRLDINLNKAIAARAALERRWPRAADWRMVRCATASVLESERLGDSRRPGLELSRLRPHTVGHDL